MSSKMFSGKTVLVVDDEQQIREFIRDEFELEGATVLEAGNGRLAFDIVQKQRVDCIISDIRMPGGDGTELLDNVRATGPQLPILLFISGFSEITVDDAFARGANGFFPKPFDTFALVEKTRELLTPFPERMSRQVQPAERVVAKDAGSAAQPRVAIGIGGMFIATSERADLALGPVSLAITYPGVKPQTLTGQGIVQWMRKSSKEQLPAGIGVEFTQLPPDSLALVEAERAKCPQQRAFIPNKLGNA